MRLPKVTQARHAAWYAGFCSGVATLGMRLEISLQLQELRAEAERPQASVSVYRTTPA
jgi:hypothetical protein